MLSSEARAALRVVRHFWDSYGESAYISTPALAELLDAGLIKRILGNMDIYELTPLGFTLCQKEQGDA